uniref:Uncharacterized protein n=1 Tax=Salix viminalis TaxID=40686 RepID=A0A6N2MVS4_SALVM
MDSSAGQKKSLMNFKQIPNLSSSRPPFSNSQIATKTIDTTPPIFLLQSSFFALASCVTAKCNRGASSSSVHPWLLSLLFNVLQVHACWKSTRAIFVETEMI